MPNSELAWAIYDLATLNHEAFVMSTWAHRPQWQSTWNPHAYPVTIDDLVKHTCGTTACLAGWTAAVAGDRLVGSQAIAEDGSNRTIQARAKELLDIDAKGTTELFLCTKEDLYDRMVDIFGPRPKALHQRELVAALLES